MNLSDLIDFCRAEALANKLFPTEEAEWRWFCREYSKTFHTPFLQVLEMSPEHVILTVFEDGLDSRRLRNREHFEKILEELRRLEDPNYDAEQAKEFDQFAAGIEEWEAQRVAENKPLPTKQGKTAESELADEAANKPAMSTMSDSAVKEGFIDLSYLADSEDER